ncbi:MAG: hypothetical protein KDH20_13070, partial [Rhodocyclaceae bacterium]|nr:hypothetical protein [Rhodocyclaceae bacterium]
MANEGASASPVPETRHKAIWLRIGGGLTLISVLLALLALLDDRQAPAPDEADPPGLPASSEPAPNIVTEAREPLIGTAVALPEPQSPVPAVAEAEPGVSAVPVSEPAPEGSAAPEVVAPVARQ